MPQLLDNAEQMPYTDFATVVDHFVERADENGTHDDRDEAIEGRSARVVGVGGSLDARAAGGDALTAAEVIAIFDKFVDAEFQADLATNQAEHGDLADGFRLARTDRQRRHDAFIAIFRTAAAATDIAMTAPGEALVNIVIDAHTWGRLLLDAGLSTTTDLERRGVDPFTGLAVDDSADLLEQLGRDNTIARMCETTNGVPLHPHDVLRAALAGHVRRAVVDSNRVIIDLGRRTRLFRWPARDAAKLLICRCEHAGCELPADWCEVDHVEQWQRDLGGTDQRNAAVLCRFHNNHKDRHRWRTRRATNGCSYTIREDGTIILPIGARPPDLEADHPLGGVPGGLDDLDDDRPDEPEDIARQTALARNRVADLTRNRR